jgi:hypothetical protein
MSAFVESSYLPLLVEELEEEVLRAVRVRLAHEGVQEDLEERGGW